MNRIVVKARVSGDGHLHLDLPVGMQEAGQEVQVSVEVVSPLAVAPKLTLRASDLLHSGLVGMWADRSDIGDSRDFARRLREQAQTRLD